MTDLMSNIKKLREITGAGFLDCKKALEQNNSNIENSIDFLRKKGLAKAGKKSSREANEGAIGIYAKGTLTSIIQINTETDFAAKNEVFLDFMDEIGNFSLTVMDSNISISEFNNLKFNDVIISDLFKNIISKIGENIILSKLIFIENKDQCLISSYIHNSYRQNIGKIAVVLKSKVKNIDNDAKNIGKNLCMHIAASKPLAMKVEDLDLSLVNREKEVQLETIRASGKPDNIVDKILEGKMQKFYSESVLLNQQYILDPDKKVSQVIANFSEANNFVIMDYKLSVLGA